LQRATRYSWIIAFGNHFRMDDATSARLRSYNTGVVLVFKLPSKNAEDLSMNDIGMLKDILLSDYKGLIIQINLLQYKWRKAHDNQQNATYTWDDNGFLL